MSYVRWTRALVSGPAGSRRQDGDLVINPNLLPTLEELQEAMPGSVIKHGFQVIGRRGQVLATQTGFESEAAARKGLRELRRALLPGVRQDVRELARAWDEGHQQGTSPRATPGNPYRAEEKEADRARE